jgi:ferric-dicitrate binding protein FerR (iron transport regulator)
VTGYRLRYQPPEQEVTGSQQRHRRWLRALLTVLAVVAFCGVLAWLLGWAYPVSMGSSP